MGAFAQVIADSGVFARNYAQVVLKDVTPEIFARKPRFQTSTGVTVVDANHPAFLFGHLSLYPSRIHTLTGTDGSAIEAPAGWNDLFKAGAECKDDVEGTIYPKMAVITAQFFKAHDAAVAYIRTLDDAKLLAQNPNEGSRDRFPTIGALASFLFSGHVMMHMGQVSTWRRCFGLASALG